ncbi:MAG TPA: hypothetical protein VEK79_21560 [Thermoanaerobaculia bacterium]|nr:hypothetical protein [Thermoanaerobaculia bacterium]
MIWKNSLAWRRAGTRGSVFQYRDVRTELGIDVDAKNEGARVFNQIVEEVESDRKRDRYYRVADDEGRLSEVAAILT